MNTVKTSGQGLVTIAKLVLVTVTILGLAITLNVRDANTLSLLPEAKAPPSLLTPRLVAHEPGPLDLAINVLSPNDAVRYKAIFAAQRQGDWEKVNALFPTLSDKRLKPHILADRYQRGQGTFEDWAEWLAAYPDLPGAETIYRLAVRQADKTQKTSLTKPKTPETWSGGNDRIESTDFSTDVDVDGLPFDEEITKLATAINSSLRKGNPGEARATLQASENKKQLPELFLSQCTAAIAAGYYFMGEREEAQTLAGFAATAKQPLGLWISGLIAWEQDNFAKAAGSFSDLADHPAVDDVVRTTANFWAYRALSLNGRSKEAWQRLEQSALGPRSFYMLLASQLLGNENKNKASVFDNPVWDKKTRAVLLAEPTGWRALALVQIGEMALAEAELRRLNPQKREDLHAAMSALAHFIPMPALSLQLASLLDERRGFEQQEALHYPLLPWQPQSGFEVDRSLLYALARHESLFDPEAVSYRGARGLMQIMPATAESIAGRNNASVSVNLSDPAVSLELGQKYVRHLVAQRQIGNNLLLVLAAYNGGPAKAARWIETLRIREGKKTPDPLLFVESLPQRETRQYIQRVLPHYWAYRARLGEPQTSLRQLAEGNWPRIPAVGEHLAREASLGEQGRQYARASVDALK